MRDYNRETNYNFTYIKFSLRCKHLNTLNDKYNINVLKKIKPEKAAIYKKTHPPAKQPKKALNLSEVQTADPVCHWRAHFLTHHCNFSELMGFLNFKMRLTLRCPRPDAQFPRAITAHGLLSPVQYRVLSSFDSCEERLNTFRQLLFYFDPCSSFQQVSHCVSARPVEEKSQSTAWHQRLVLLLAIIRSVKSHYELRLRFCHLVLSRVC